MMEKEFERFINNIKTDYKKWRCIICDSSSPNYMLCDTHINNVESLKLLFKYLRKYDMIITMKT